MTPPTMEPESFHARYLLATGGVPVRAGQVQHEGRGSASAPLAELDQLVSARRFQIAGGFLRRGIIRVSRLIPSARLSSGSSSTPQSRSIVLRELSASSPRM